MSGGGEMEKAFDCTENGLCDFAKKLRVILFGNGTPGFISTTDERIEANENAIRKLDDYDEVKGQVKKHEAVYNQLIGLKAIVVIMGLVLAALNIISIILKK